MTRCRPKAPRKTTLPFLVLLGASLFAWTPPSRAGVGRWTALGPYGGTIVSVELDPHGTGRLLAIELSAGLVASTDDGESWTTLSSRPRLTVSFDPSNPDVLYSPRAGNRDTAYRSSDGGVTWMQLGYEGYPTFVSRIVVSPVDPSVLFALSDLYGVYRSTDGGATWAESNEGLGGVRSPRTLWIEPAEPNTFFLHSAYPDFPDGPRAKEFSSSAVFRSTDGGVTWAKAAAGLPDGAVTRVAFAPGDPPTLYAVVDGVHLFRSTDRAGHWTPLSDLPDLAISLVVDPHTPTTLHAVLVSGIYRSQDGGTSWQDLGVDLGSVAVTQLVATAAPGVLLLGTSNDGFWRSLDRGLSWSEANGGMPPLRARILGVDPSSPTTLYTPGEIAGVHRSLDGGRSWEVTGRLVPSFGSLVIDPLQPSTLYSGGDGIRRSDDHGDTWLQVFEDTHFPVLALAIDPQVPRIVYAGSTQLGVMRSLDRGKSWETFSTPSFDLYDVQALAVAPEEPRFVYAGTGRGYVLRSANKGERWTRIDAGLPEGRLGALAVGPDKAVYVAIDDTEGPFRSLDRGNTWSPPVEGFFGLRALQVDPLSSEVYAGRSDGRVFRSRDRGRSWQPLTERGLPRLSGTELRDLKLVPRPGETPILYSATSTGLYELRPVERESVLAFQDGRFLVEVAWRDFRNRTGEGTVAVVPADEPVEVELASPDSAVLQFFSGDNWEMLVKVLDGRRINGNYWVFAAAATNVAYTVEVTDTSCGVTKTYRNALGVSSPAVTDDAAFVPCARPEPPDCTPSADVLCLGEGGRFRVVVTWRDFRDRTGVGRQVRIPRAGAARSDDSGLFYFFSEENWEMLVKVLDGCRINGHYWVFSAATTTVEYTLKVTDTASGLTKTYSNPQGRSAAATTDDEAFATCGFS